MQNTKSASSLSNSILPKTKIMSNHKKNIFAIFLIFLISLIIAKPNLCIASIYNGLSVWAKCVVPSLLPFMFFTKLLTNLNFLQKITNKFSKLNSKLFNAPPISAHIFLMSIISGYPVGAKMIAEYHKMGILSANDTNKLCTFCSTSGPLFIIGSVGTAMIGSAKIGYIIFVSHILGAILNGILFRNLWKNKDINNETKSQQESFAKINIKCITESYDENISSINKLDKSNYDKINSNINIFNNNKIEKQNSQNMLASSMTDTILSCLTVGGYIAIAFLVVDIFLDLNLFFPITKLLELLRISPNITNNVLSGITEVSKGCLLISNLNISQTLIATLSSFLIGFGGICVFLQAITFLSEAGVNKKFYIFQKITHGLISSTITFLLCLIFI